MNLHFGLGALSPCSQRDSSLEAGSYFRAQELNSATSPPGARGYKQSSLALAPFEHKMYFKEAKTGAKYIIRDMAQSMGENTEKLFI